MDQGTTNDLLEELAKRSSKAIFIYDQEIGEFIYANPAFEDLWNKAIEIVRSNPEELVKTIHPEDKEYVRDKFKKLIEDNERNVELEFRITFPNEQLKWIVVNAHLIVGDHRNLIAGFAEDLTSLRLHLNNAKKFAAKKDSVLEILAHDLAGPLSNIATVSELLTERGKEYNDPQFNKMIDIIARTSERSIRLIREFVKQEFLETANTELITKRVDMVKVMKDIITQYKNSEEDINKTFKLTSTKEKLYADIDDYKFSQVINNLISNAIKFTHDGGLIHIDIAEQENTLLITVADNGIGIPEMLQDELFEKFTKARRPGLKGEPSVGLGMSIIKTIVEWHKGRIWFESEVDKGSTFYIELPKHA